MTFGSAINRSSFLLILLAGCTSGGDIDSQYGRRSGLHGQESVNGTAILSQWFEDAGFRTQSWHRLSPRLETADVIVWVPNDFAVPRPDCRAFLEKWLAEKPGRTLIYIGRDFDATALYWRTIQQNAPLEQIPEIARRTGLAEAEHDTSRPKTSDEKADWFRTVGNLPKRKVNSLSGPWSDGINAAKTDIYLQTSLEDPRDPQSKTEAEQTPEVTGLLSRFPMIQDRMNRIAWEPVLSSDQGTLIAKLTSQDFSGSQAFVISNGSFLLNLPLVNHEHRKIADKLVAACGSPGKVFFLESEAGGPPILKQEPVAKLPTGFEALTTWPLGTIIMHLTALGLLACFVYLPIFGRPRQSVRNDETNGNVSDFGLHLSAMAELLEKTENYQFANDLLQSYRHNSKAHAASSVVARNTNETTR